MSAVGGSIKSIRRLPKSEGLRQQQRDARQSRSRQGSRNAGGSFVYHRPLQGREKGSSDPPRSLRAKTVSEIAAGHFFDFGFGSGDHAKAWLQSPYERLSIASVTFSSAVFTRLKAAAYFARSMFDQ